VQVCLDFSINHQVGLVIEDDGQGALSTSGGFGLIGLRERVHQLRGEIEFQTDIDKGFRIMIKVPVDNDPNFNRR
jgi:signal transduction histidine kinase